MLIEGEKMSTISLENLNLEKIKNHLKKILNAETISEFTSLPSAVNTTFVFEANGKKYVMKMMTTPITEEWEKFRFNKVKKILKRFSQNEHVPVPEFIHLEENEEILGYRFLIISFIEGQNLWSIWRNLTKEEILPIVKELGKTVKTIHSIEYDYFGEIEDCENVSRETNYEKKMRNNIEEYVETLIERKIFPQDLLQKTQSYFNNLFSKINSHVKPTLIHNDIHQANMIVKKDEDGIYHIQAILDWEWAAAENPIEDLIYIQNGMLEDRNLREAFFSEYYQGKRNSIEDYEIYNKIFNILWTLDGVVCGWTYHNPTAENLNRDQKNLEELIEE